MPKTLIIRIRKERLPTKSSHEENRIIRDLGASLAEGNKYYGLLKPKHFRFFRTWIKKFDFPFPVGLLVYRKTRKRSYRDGLAFTTSINGTAWVGLSTETLKNGTDWQNSIIHELLHLMFRASVGDSRILRDDYEENMVIALSGWISRSKEGKIYSNKVFGTNN